ncbi:MAG: PspC domain-containing protein [Flavobacteriales bacterium]|nr:PspC domain-containing protein [Flavobacteriales bacterium]
MYDDKILGVCVWLSRKFDVNVGYVRIAFLVAVICGLGVPVLIYFGLAFYKSKIE